MSVRRTLLSAGLLNLRRNTDTNQSVMGLELLQRLWGIVDESETSCLSTTKLSSQTKNIDLVLVGLVEFGELASEFVFRDVGAVGVENITMNPLECPSYSKYPHPVKFDDYCRFDGELTRPFACGREEGCE
jgi:hypothetical protein